MTVTLLGKRWKFRFCFFRSETGGECDSPSKVGKEIRVHSGLPEERELAASLHEMHHACDWHKDEEWVEEASNDMAHVLIRLGWRKTAP